MFVGPFPPGNTSGSLFIAANQVVYQLQRRIPLGEISSLSLSTLQDNFVVLHHQQVTRKDSFLLR